MNERLKCILLALAIDLIFIGCVLLLLSIPTIQFVIIASVGLIICTYKAVESHRQVSRIRKAQEERDE